MSMAIGHFAVGASTTMVAFYMLPLHIRLRIRVAQVFIFVLGGFWAMLPDIAQFSNLMHYFNKEYWMKIGFIQQTRFSDLTGIINRINAFHDSRWANICFFHQFMDVTDKNDSPLVSGVLILVTALIVSYILVSDLQKRRLWQK